MQCSISQSPIQAFAEENYHLTRASWFALYAPDSGRHDALLAEDTPPIYRQLFDAILEGSRGLARLAVEGGEALELLDYIAQLPRPRQIPTRRLEIPENPDLATALFSHVGEEELEIDGIGTGEWPAAPSHTCAAREATGTALTIRAHETRGARMFNPSWRTCPACLHKRVKRIARQTLLTIATAGRMEWAILERGDYRKWAANMRQHRKRTGAAVHYRALPQEGGQVFVMSTHGLAGAAVPVARRALYDLILPYANTPDDARASSSRGYGGDYKRLRGDGRGGGVRLWTDAPLERVAAALGTQVKKGRATILAKIDAAESYQKLAEAGIALHTRKGQARALEALVGDLLGTVTLKVHSDLPEECTLSVTHDAGGGTMVPLDAPPLFDYAAEGVAEWPIYLP